MSIEGDWHATKQHMGCGYSSTWTVAAVDDEHIVVEEQCGSTCCGCVPNCCPKRGCLAHRMRREGDAWVGRLGGKPLRLSKNDDGTLHHVTTDGPMTMTRA